MINTDDYITIIRDIEELERIGFVFKFKNEKLDVSIKDSITEDEIIEKLNSYRGVIKNIDYYNHRDIFEAYIMKSQIEGGRLDEG